MTGKDEFVPDVGCIYYAFAPLLALAEKSLPAKAKLVSQANKAVAETSEHDATAFMPSSGGGGAILETMWTTLRDELQTYFVETQRNLHDTSTTLIGYVQDTTEKDNDGADQLKLYTEHYNSGTDEYRLNPNHPIDKPSFSKPVTPEKEA